MSPRLGKALVGPLVNARSSRRSSPPGSCPHFDITPLISAAKAGALRTEKEEDEALGQEEDKLRIVAIVFRNYYVREVTIRQQQPRADGKMQWVTVLRRKRLMKSPHLEDDAQHWHAISVNEFADCFLPFSMLPLRLILHQPSPLWSNVELHHVNCIISGNEGGGS
jgi:hypothetical protein